MGAAGGAVAGALPDLGRHWFPRAIVVIAPLVVIGSLSTTAPAQDGAGALPLADWVQPMVYGSFVLQGLALLTAFVLYACVRWGRPSRAWCTWCGRSGTRLRFFRGDGRALPDAACDGGGPQWWRSRTSRVSLTRNMTASVATVTCNHNIGGSFALRLPLRRARGPFGSLCPVIGPSSIAGVPRSARW